MAGLRPSFQSGSNLAIYIDGKAVAFATNLSISDTVPHAAIGGIGGYSYSALEPLAYTTNGSFTITRYSRNSHAGETGNLRLPTRFRKQDGGGESTDPQDGNSMLMSKHFNPLALMVTSTFDIVIYERQRAGNLLGTVDLSATPTHRIEDCRLTDYALSFTPGAVIAENIGFIALRLVDLKVAEGELTGTTNQDTV